MIDLLHRTNMTAAKPISSPMISLVLPPHSLKIMETHSQTPILYHNTVESLPYLSFTRQILLLLLMRYVNSCIDLQETVNTLLKGYYTISGSHHTIAFYNDQAHSLDLQSFSDSNWAIVLMIGDPLYANVFFFGPNLLLWSSQKQKIA